MLVSRPMFGIGYRFTNPALALAFNVTVADAVTVDASTSSHEFHEHEIEVRGGVASPPESAHGVITTTIVAPGPLDAIAPL